MKRSTICVALPLALLSLAGCSSDNSATGASPAPNATAGESPAPAVADHTPGQTPGNADQGDAKVTKCEVTPNGVEIAVDIKNTTEQKRMYILTGVAYDSDKKPVASAAVMVDAVDPGASGSGTGRSTGAVEGDVICEVTQIESMPQ
ncbi:hypothetical protein BJY21_003083 [Kineosphaera limosa]|uniref:Lipoprotein n=1 Tax=Kineosphaera limosa NBRC 100340 TaxID=1184609 RepID=K6WQK9_9MICO|nr:hypothetical protein [Kineosphaera limosa]NYE01899.1 hypothetical protein [Kineosphaera limosa]GAB96126.1 hypothetical protein KILIM_032_00110 [Kineosphaera limosa NBRC 100340]